MLIQTHDDQEHVVRFGSKCLSAWQRSYVATKLELLVVIVLECSSYRRGRHFIIETDHQAFQPLYQKQLKGIINERSFDYNVVYKMCVRDVLS